MDLGNDTIAAIATPLGEGGLAVIRISGPQALAVANACFVSAQPQAPPPSEAPTHTLHYGHLVRNGRRLDEVMLAVMRAPRTFTREDVVELSCHGGFMAATVALETVLAQGARLAHPGEFTQRAFLNGRLDLVQAEAVADVIHARTELALAAAAAQLEGRLSQRIEILRTDLIQVLAHVEAQLDFPEDDLAPATRAQMQARLDSALALIEELLRTAPEGQLLRRGLRVAIIGRPNTGKSSLLNLLLGQERAIVSPLPGTTRDTIEAAANIRGLPVVFIDTAGLRSAQDPIEAEGVRRSQAALERAELVLHVFDNAEPLDAADRAGLAAPGSVRRILVRNKSDLPRRLEWPADLAAPAVDVCCLTGLGLETLKDTLVAQVWRGAVASDRTPVMINARHQAALERARQAAQHCRDALRAGAALDLVALDLRAAVNAVGEIVGKTATEDLLDAIFREFCVGK